MQKLMKVKATDKFSFPLSIDLGPYQSPSSNAQDAESQQYDLQAILIHKGSSASQGHYGNMFAGTACAMMKHVDIQFCCLLRVKHLWTTHGPISGLIQSVVTATASF